MNSKSLAFLSFFLALVCHWAVIQSCIIIFPVSSEKLNPKFYFLGPILTEGDLPTASPFKQSEAVPGPRSITNALKHHAESPILPGGDIQSSPFSVETINKPVLPQTITTTPKVNLKSSFDPIKVDGDRQNENNLIRTDEFGLREYRSLEL